MPSPSTASIASPSRARRHRSGNARVSFLSPARWRMKKTALAASSDRSAPLAKRSSTPSSPGAASSQWASTHSAASCGRSFPALAKAWIAVSTSIEVLGLSASRCGRRWPVVVCSSDRDTWCGWQRWLCRSTCHGGPRSLPVPGEQLVEPVDRRAPGDQPPEPIRQIGLRVEVVQLRRVDQTGQDRPRPGSALTPGEERILTAQCNRPHGSLDQMNEVTIHLYCRLANGKIEDAQHTFDLSDFGGFLPAVGDKILDPGVPASLERHVPENRRLWTVVDRVFNPRDTKDFVALVIESCPVSDNEAALLPPG